VLERGGQLFAIPLFIQFAEAADATSTAQKDSPEPARLFSFVFKSNSRYQQYNLPLLGLTSLVCASARVNDQANVL